MDSRQRLVALVVVVVAAASFAAAGPSMSIATVFCAERHLQPPVHASVVKADATATEYALQCGPDWWDEGTAPCGDTYNDTMILTLGPSTMALTGRSEQLTRGFDCKLLPSSSASCDFFLDGKYALESGHFPWDVEPDEYADLMIPLIITAGLEKLDAATAAGTAASTALPRSTATRLDAPQTTGTTRSDETTSKTTERRLTEATGSSISPGVQPTASSTVLTTTKSGGARSTRATVALLGTALGLMMTALGVA